MKKTHWIITCILTLSICATMYYVTAQNTHKCESILSNKESTILELTERIGIISKQSTDLQKQLDNLTYQITTVQQEQRKQAKLSNKGSERLISLGEYTITGYCGCRECCGDYALNRPGGIVKGAAGVELIEGISVAAPLPLGTKIVINGHTYIVQDRISKKIVDKYGGKIIDIYKTDHEEAWNVGNGKTEVFVVK